MIKCLKVVPDGQPNANGKWLHQVEIPKAFRGRDAIFGYIPEPGHHIVKTHRPVLDCSGPMHLGCRYEPCTGDHW